MTYARRPETDEYPPSMAGYVGRIPAGADILAFLATQRERMSARLAGVPEAFGEHRYQPGKWSVKEVIGHLSDTERVFAYRALRIARADATPLAVFDDKAYVRELHAGERSLASMVTEWSASREATLALFTNLPEAAWARRGTAGDAPVSVRALAYITAGHTDHHLEIFGSRYGLPGADPAQAPAPPDQPAP
jgi:hypothetical protein